MYIIAFYLEKLQSVCFFFQWTLKSVSEVTLIHPQEFFLELIEMN